MPDAIELTVYTLFFVTLYFEVFLLLSFLEHFGRHTRTLGGAQPNRYPSVAVIVPCYNEEATIRETVNSLLALEYPRAQLSLYLVNDGSTDGTLSILREFEHESQVTVIDKENGGKHTALNAALPLIDAELIGCLDSDSFVAPNALTEIVRTLAAHPEAMAITPAIIIHHPQSILQYLQRAEYGMSAFIRRTFSFLDSQFVTPGPFSFFRREVFAELGPYRHAYNTEDLEIALRMQERHMKIQNAHRAHIYTKGPATLRALVRQRIRWTYGFIKNMVDYRHLLFAPRHGHLGILVLPFSIFGILSSFIFFGLMLQSLYLVADQQLLVWQAVGFQLPGLPALDWYFINTHTVILLTMLVIVLTCVLIFIGKSLTGHRINPLGRDMLAYVALYGFVAPLWLITATVNAATARQTSWQSERS